jgi:two-component system sensor histidine kinase CpxA
MRRLSLFWKVYLGFLLALFLPLLINEVIFTLEKDHRVPPPHRNIDRLVEWAAAHLAREAGDLLERGETAGLSALLAQAGAMSGAEFSVVRRGGSGPSSGPDEPPARDVVSVIAPFVVSGDAYHLSARFSPFRGKPPFPPRHPWMLLIPMGVGAVLCFVLVRHIVAPILDLRGATLRLGQGNLAARAGVSVTGRGDEIADLGKAFDRMAERIEELITSQRRLMGDISHELRSPLQRLDVALTLARKGCSPEAAGFLDRADREAGRMGDMVGQILKLTEAELNPPIRFSPSWTFRRFWRTCGGRSVRGRVRGQGDCARGDSRYARDSRRRKHAPERRRKRRPQRAARDAPRDVRRNRGGKET